MTEETLSHDEATDTTQESPDMGSDAPAAPPTELAAQADSGAPLLDLNKRRLTILYDARNPQQTFFLNAEGFESPVMIPSEVDPSTGVPVALMPLTPHPIMQRSQMRQALLMAIQAIENQEMAGVQAGMAKMAAAAQAKAEAESGKRRIILPHQRNPNRRMN